LFVTFVSSLILMISEQDLPIRKCEVYLFIHL